MKRLRPPQGKEVPIELDGETLQVPEGETLATALLASGVNLFSRSVKYHRPRGPFCLSGGCSHCLMRVDGRPNVYTCKTKVRAGMKVQRQNSYPSANTDVFASVNWLFPRGMNHHEMFAGVPIAEKVMLEVARHLAGLGVLPDQAVTERLRCETLRSKVAIAGGGAAGSAAAAVLTEAGIDTLLFERDDALGGRLRYGPPEHDAPPAPAQPQKGARFFAPVVGLYDDEGGRFFAVTQYGPEGPRLIKAYAETFLIATGGHGWLLPFENNDLPGVLAGRAATLLIRRDGVLPGERVAVVGTGTDLYGTAALLEQSGALLATILDVRTAPPSSFAGRAVQGMPLKAHGRGKVSGLTFEAAGKVQRVDCDAIVLASPPSPAFELATQGGAEVIYDGALQSFIVQADADGRTANAAVYVAGELRGPCSAAEAAASGARAARAILQAQGQGVSR